MSTTVHVIGRYGVPLGISHLLPGNRIEIVESDRQTHLCLSLTVEQLDELIAVATAARDGINRITQYHQSNNHAPEGNCT